jgi:protein-S-isoprenylcysteine O-methyltransferase Ste14
VTEAAIHHALTLAEIGLAALTVVSVVFVTAPYGRHERSGFGPKIGGRLGWVLMELPASLVWLAIFLLGAHALEPAPLVLLAIWQSHYAHRAFVYPLTLERASPMPVLVVALGASFNVLNAYVNARWVSELGSYPSAWLADPRFLAGAALFATGYAVNKHADSVLRRLRKRSPDRYSIPHGGLYRWVSCPNYLGEILLWIGWATATWSLAGLAFALYTIANLAPRALSHHRWYKATFAEYPKDRRALVPFVI